MLRPPWNRPRALPADLLLDILVGTTGVNILRQGWQGDFAIGQLVGGNEVALALVPVGQDLGRRCAANDTWVDEPCKFDVGDVSRGAENALEIPYGLCSSLGEAMGLIRGMVRSGV